MRRTACVALAAACSVGTPALAQSSPSGALPSPEQIANKDTVTVGAGVALIPDYEGSDDYRMIPAGAIRGKINGISFSTRGTYLYVDVVPQSGKFGFDAGPIAGFRGRGVTRLQQHAARDGDPVPTQQGFPVDLGQAHNAVPAAPPPAPSASEH